MANGIDKSCVILMMVKVVSHALALKLSALVDGGAVPPTRPCLPKVL